MGITMGELVSGLAGLMLVGSTVKQFLPSKFQSQMQKIWDRIVRLFFPYMNVTFHEYGKDNQRINEAYTSIESYLGTKSMKQAELLTADMARDNKSLVLSLDDGQELGDKFENVKVKWEAHTETIPGRHRPFEKRSYVLSFHRRYRDVVMEEYINHVMEVGEGIKLKNRKRKLYTNNSGDDWYWSGRWSSITFQHPATFDTLAMDPWKKEEILDDLEMFKNGKDYYAQIGKAWKRGYLLYGPPGTGKSTMIAAIANFLDYNIYDLELTTVKDNADLKRLLIETVDKSIIIIEDIDCSLDLTGKRKKKKEKGTEKGEEKDDDSDDEDKKKDETEEKSKVTLSGLLNFIDGIWSSCGEERIIIFTTNHVEKLDPALIRRGRMDKHIEMSYCKFEAFKVLAKNYLDIDSHPLFEDIRILLERTNMRPCDVAENLIPKTRSSDYVENCLMKLIEATKEAKERQEKEEGKKEEFKNKKCSQTSTRTVQQTSKPWR